MTDLDKLAKGLTEAQRDCMQGRVVRWKYAALAQVKSALRRKGLITQSKLGTEFTPLGLALKAHIERTTHD